MAQVLAWTLLNLPNFKKIFILAVYTGSILLVHIPEKFSADDLGNIPQKIVVVGCHILWVDHSAVAKGLGPGGGASACVPHFGLLKILFLKSHLTTRQPTMMGKGIIKFKHNSLLTFLVYLRNCWQSTAAQKCDAIIRVISAPLRMCRRREM